MKKSSEMNSVAFFPGSFDPFTVGHQSIVDRALTLFDEIVIGVGMNGAKHSMMSAEERVSFIENVYKGHRQVKTLTYTGLTVDAAQACGATCMLRGVRMIQDFEYEKNLAEVNRQLSGIETVLLYTLPEYGHISSSIVRELISYGRDVSAYLPKGCDMSIISEKITKNIKTR